MADSGIAEHEGELFVDSAADQVGGAVFRLGQALTRIHDLSFLTRTRVSSTFYEDLEHKVRALVSPQNMIRDFVIPGMPHAENYKIDFKLESPRSGDTAVPLRDSEQRKSQADGVDHRTLVTSKRFLRLSACVRRPNEGLEAGCRAAIERWRGDGVLA